MSWQMKELEEKYKEREQQWKQTHCYVEAVKMAATPDIGKSRTSDECPNEIETRILCSSNSVNRQISQDSVLIKGNDSNHQIRNKRHLRSNEIENHFLLPSSSLRDRKITRKSDPPPKISRIGKITTKPTAVASQAPLSHKRASTSRDQAQGVKERDSKKKIWSR
jgi:kinesin family protein C2/C3